MDRSRCFADTWLSAILRPESSETVSKALRRGETSRMSMSHRMDAGQIGEDMNPPESFAAISESVKAAKSYADLILKAPLEELGDRKSTRLNSSH